MNIDDLKKIIGVKEDEADYVPVAMLLGNGYACFGHYNSQVNDGLIDSIVVLNASLMELKGAVDRNRPGMEDFREFLLEIVSAYEQDREFEIPTREDLGKTVPLVAFPLNEIAMVYPVAHILELLARAEEKKNAGTVALFDFSRSEILSVLRMKLW